MMPLLIMWPSLRRARNLSDDQLGWHLLLGASVVASLLVPVLIVILGLIVQLALAREVSTAAAVRVGPLRLSAGWPWLGRADYCLLLLIAIGLVVSVALFAALVAVQWARQRLLARVALQLRESIHAQSIRLGPGDLLEESNPSREQLFTDQLQRVVEGLEIWWRAVPHAVSLLAALLILAAATDFLLALLAILVAIMVWRVSVWVRAAARDWQSHYERTAASQLQWLLEGLRVAPLLSTLVSLPAAQKMFRDRLTDYHQAVRRSRLARSLVFPTLLLVTLCAAACLLLVLGLSPRATVANSVVLGATLICAYWPIARLYALRETLQEPERAAGEIFAYVDREPPVLQMSGAGILERLRTSIELDRVTLTDSAGRKLLDQVSLAFPAGKKVGVMALEARTPLALAALLLRFCDPIFGRVLFDSRDIRHVTLESLREQIALVRPSHMLFPGTIAENITCGDGRFSKEQIEAACRQAGATEFLEKLPTGIDTMIGNQGASLPPAQAFRVILARALLRDPSVLILEEPPQEGTDDLESIVAALARERTLIFLPNRIQTLRSLDHIFVFHEGRLAHEGKHATLLQSSDLYRHLNYLKFNPYRGQGC